MISSNENIFFKAEHIYASYGEKSVLDDISFSIASTNSLAALIGPNGCGKTTLLKSICNLIPHSGKCILNQKIIEAMPLKQRACSLSYIPQRSGIQISMSVMDMVLMGFNPHLKLLEKPNAAMHEAALNALDMTGTAHLADRDYLTLSEGEKQLCILARTLVQDTDMMLLDEPDSALDFHNRYSMMKTIKNIVTSSNKSALICLHDPVVALDFCDQLILLKNGKILTTVFPKKDTVMTIEAAFSSLYGNVSVHEATDKHGCRRLFLINDIM